MLFVFGTYLILNFINYGFVNVSLSESNTIAIVVFLGIITIILNILRIVFFN